MIVQEVRHQASGLQSAEGGELGDVDHDGLLRLTLDDERHHTIATGVGLTAGTEPAIDGHGHDGQPRNQV